MRLAYRFADGHGERLPALAAELVALQPDVMVTNATLGARAAQHATMTIPIVVAFATDLVEAGLVASLARPGGNLTGQHSRDLEVMDKLLELLKEVVPTMTSVAVLTSLTANPFTPHFTSALDATATCPARGLGIQGGLPPVAHAPMPAHPCGVSPERPDAHPLSARPGCPAGMTMARSACTLRSNG
jgi:ABC transporter substrate binding protein